MSHAVARLRARVLDAVLAHPATGPRVDRSGPRTPRCERCRLRVAYCLCTSARPAVSTRAGVCLLMAAHEPLKPTNTGWLVADVVAADTSAFTWSRTAVDPALLAQLGDPQRQPYVVFPGEFAAPERVVTEIAPQAGRRPLFVVPDGTWSEACKMFRKSPYLDRLPVLSLRPDQVSRYRLRRSSHAHHFCTAEVVAMSLDLAGDHEAARALDAHLDEFTRRYLRAKQNLAPLPEPRDQPADSSSIAFCTAR